MKLASKYGKKTALALSLWVKLARCYGTISKASFDDIKNYNLTGPQFAALETLGHLGPMTIGSLSRKQLVTGGNMTLVIDNLEKESLVERIFDKKDRRSITVKLTAKGEKLFNSIFAKHAKRMDEVMNVLSEAEQIELSNLLKKLGKQVRV